MGRRSGPFSRALSYFLSLPTTTMEGRFFLVGLVALGFLASATDRNYVLLVLSLLLAVVFASVLFSTLNLRGIRFTRSLPDAVIAGEPFTVRVKVENRRRWLPARGVLLKDALQTTLGGAESRCFAERIPAGGQVTFVYTARIRRRGAYNITNALLSTRFPFGLFEKRVLARHPSRVVVYPEMREVAGDRLPGARNVHLAVHERSTPQRGGDEFRALRDYRPGDDPRRIAWRVSARQQRLVLKEMEQENRGRIAVVLATSLKGVGPVRRRTALERSVSLAASLIRFLHRERRPFVFGAPGLVIEGLGRDEALHACLEHLATIRADARYDAAAVLKEIGTRRLRGLEVILITPGRRALEGADAAGLRLHHVWSTGQAAARLLRRGW